eukprot:s564_g18.t1
MIAEDIAFSFDDDESPFSVPSLDALLPKVRQWLSGQPELAVYYTPDEAEPYEPESPYREQKRPPARKATPSGGGPKAKKPTTASLAVEAGFGGVQNVAIPISLSECLPAFGVSTGNSCGKLPERSSKIDFWASENSYDNEPWFVGFSEVDARLRELAALESEKLGQLTGSLRTEEASLAQAVLEQSRALTSAAQIASQHGDPLTELAGPTTGTRGAAGRAKLQAELAMHRGSFFQAVLQQMSRRMTPTASAEATPATMLARGVSGLKYLERFGGGRQRELGQLQFQVMTAFDYLLEDNVGAAKDTIALLAVTLEQACLDNGRLDLATLLCLQEDPPSAIFQNRILSATSRARSFAPLADQRWVTSALAFLKELEVISSKRVELTGGGKPGSETSSEAPKAKAKAQPKRKGKGKGQTQAEDAETAQ